MHHPPDDYLPASVKSHPSDMKLSVARADLPLDATIGFQLGMCGPVFQGNVISVRTLVDASARCFDQYLPLVFADAKVLHLSHD
jgi:hypothetical protein